MVGRFRPSGYPLLLRNLVTPGPGPGKHRGRAGTPPDASGPSRIPVRQILNDPIYPSVLLRPFLSRLLFLPARSTRVPTGSRAARFTDSNKFANYCTLYPSPYNFPVVCYLISNSCNATMGRNRVYRPLVFYRNADKRRANCNPEPCWSSRHIVVPQTMLNKAAAIIFVIKGSEFVVFNHQLSGLQISIRLFQKFCPFQ